jgi:hypothetical protein
LGLVLLAGALVVWFTHSSIAPLSIVLLITIAWALGAITLAVHDFWLRPDAPWSKDSQLFDVWSIAHFGAGLVFGIWYVPIVYCVGLAAAWELFEILVKGFGDKETWFNRCVDIGLAVVGWLIVVILLIAFVKTSFPFATSVSSPQSGQATSVRSTHQPAHKTPEKPKPAGR